MPEFDDIALNKPATQSSVSPWSHGSVGQDARGANSEKHPAEFSFHTDFEANPWWQVDLEHKFIIEKVCLLNRTNCAERLRHFSLLTSPDGWSWDLIYQKSDDSVFDNLVLTGKRLARFIRIQLDGENALHLRKFQVFGRRPLQGDGEVGAAPQTATTIPPSRQPARRRMRGPKTTFPCSLSAHWRRLPTQFD